MTIICIAWAAVPNKCRTDFGAQAGEAKLREVISVGGFINIRRATETAFNMVLEARG